MFKEDDDEEDLEALRMAALMSLRPKQLLPPPPASNVSFTLKKH